MPYIKKDGGEGCPAPSPHKGGGATLLLVVAQSILLQRSLTQATFLLGMATLKDCIASSFIYLFYIYFFVQNIKILLSN
jgi:hypothetical protein